MSTPTRKVRFLLANSPEPDGRRWEEIEAQRGVDRNDPNLPRGVGKSVCDADWPCDEPTPRPGQRETDRKPVLPDDESGVFDERAAFR
jgi:hypothetical protein